MSTTNTRRGGPTGHTARPGDCHAGPASGLAKGRAAPGPPEHTRSGGFSLAPPGSAVTGVKSHRNRTRGSGKQQSGAGTFLACPLSNCLENENVGASGNHLLGFCIGSCSENRRVSAVDFTHAFRGCRRSKVSIQRGVTASAGKEKIKQALQRGKIELTSKKSY